jgi:hypothetical protein
MSITVVGGFAYDAVKAPFGERERMLGAAATNVALSTTCEWSARVGGDFAGHDRVMDAALHVFSWHSLRQTFLASPDGPRSEFSRTAGEQCCSAHIENECCSFTEVLQARERYSFLDPKRIVI